MKLEKFKEKNPKKKIIVIFTVCCILLLAGVFLYTSFAIFTEDKEFNVIHGIYQDPGDIYFAYYIDGEITRDLPKQNTGYIFDEESSNCTNGVIPTFDNSTWKFTADYSGYNATDYTRTKCNLHFKTGTKTVSTVLGNLEVYTYTPDFTKSACDDETCESHEKGIFGFTNNTGGSYYYRGSVENNYVFFAGYYWRIIRLTNTGFKIIYDGTSPHSNGEVSEDRQAGTSQFNSSYDDNAYVGYVYDLGYRWGVNTSSTIKISNEQFYADHLLSYDSYIDHTSGFCVDRSMLNSQADAGTGTVPTYYLGYLRVIESRPTLACDDDYLYTDLYFDYPIGLITVDEVMMAGSGGGYFNGDYNHQKSCLDNYLVTGNAYWTITPAGGYDSFPTSGWKAIGFQVNAHGGIDDYQVNQSLGLRPVINIRGDVTVSGDGTIKNPYVFSK